MKQVHCHIFISLLRYRPDLVSSSVRRQVPTSWKWVGDTENDVPPRGVIEAIPYKEARTDSVFEAFALAGFSRFLSSVSEIDIVFDLVTPRGSLSLSKSKSEMADLDSDLLETDILSLDQYKSNDF